MIDHALIVLCITLTVRSSSILRFKSLQAEREEYKKNWDHCDEGWKDREDELRRILRGERDREISQLKAEHDSYVGVLEEKLARTRTLEQSLSLACNNLVSIDSGTSATRRRIVQRFCA